MKSVLCVLVGMLLLSSGVEGQDGAKSTQAAPVEVGGAIATPQKRLHVQPVYPALAKQSRVAGTVSVSIVIGATGTVERATVVKSIQALNDAAIAAVKQWKYAPTLVNGVAVPVTMIVQVNFAL